MEQKAYLLYSGNAWLNTSSLCLLSVCTTPAIAVRLAIAHSNDGDEALDDESIEELESNRQTYGRDENYLICEVTMNKIE